LDVPSKTFPEDIARLLNNSIGVSVLKGRGFNRLRKKSNVVRVLKGRGFKPRRKCHKSVEALAAEVRRRTANEFFRSLFNPRRKCHIINPALQAAEKRPEASFSWKSGASAPRKSFGIDVGFSPCGRPARGKRLFPQPV
jgi:hypothetical protein